jgi:tetratricopeptide (TPR) repeat protein
LSAALLAGETFEGSIERIIVINPAATSTHIHPIELRDVRFHSVPDKIHDSLAWNEIARKIAEHVRGLDSPLGGQIIRKRPRWHGPPAQGTSRFVGRWNEVWALHSGLLAEDFSMTSGGGTTPLGCVFIRGIGGVGKTQLAIQYARQCAGAWPGGVYWLSGAIVSEDTEKARSASLLEQIQVIAQEIGIEIEGKSLRAIQHLIAAHFEEINQRVLWIVDDMPANASAGEVRAWLGPSSLTRTIVTTRSKRFDWENLGKVLDLNNLSEAEALELLARHRTPDCEEGKLAKKIANGLGWHPLAIDVTGALLRTQDYAEVLRQIETPSQDALELAAALAGELPDQHEASMAMTLIQSMKLLKEDGMTVLQLATLLAQAPIPDHLVVRAFAKLADHEKLRAVDLERGAAAISETYRQSLSERIHKDEVEIALSVHQLVRRTVTRYPQAGLSEKKKAGLWETAVQVCLAELEKTDDLQKHEALTLWVPHGRHLTRQTSDRTSADLLGWIARWDYERGAYDAALEGYAKQLRMREQLPSMEASPISRSRSNLGSVLYAMGEFKRAREVFEETLIFQRGSPALGNKHPDTLSTLNNLGTALRKLGEYESAKRIFEEELDLSREVNGPKHQETLASINNLALAYSDLRQPEKALKLHEEEAQLSSQILGAEHQDTLVSKHNLAETYRELSRFNEARTLHEEVLQVRTRLLGRKHAETLRSMGNLGRTCYELRENNRARELLEEVLTIRTEQNGAKFPLVTQDAWSLYQVLKECEQPASEKLFKEFLQWLREADPEILQPPQDVIRQHVLKL